MQGKDKETLLSELQIEIRCPLLEDCFVMAI